MDFEECFIPNKEIIEMVNGSRELLERTLQGDEEYVAAALDKAHMRSTNPLTYNNEASFQSAITQIHECRIEKLYALEK